MCLKIENDGDDKKDHWIVTGGCYENNEKARYTTGEPNHFYDFQNVPIEVHPVLKEVEKRPIKKVEEVHNNNHGFLKFLMWFFFILFLICLIVGIVLLVMMFLNKKKGSGSER